MKRNILIGLFLIAISFTSQAQNKKETFVNDLAYKNISQFSTNDFLQMDYNFLGFLPTLKEFINPVNQFKEGNKNTFRYIDSLDILKPSKDSIRIKIYTQNYAYSSQNTYSLGANKNKKNNHLMIFNVKLDQKMKSVIAESETFRKPDFELNITEKNIYKNVQYKE